MKEKFPLNTPEMVRRQAHVNFGEQMAQALKNTAGMSKEEILEITGKTADAEYDKLNELESRISKIDGEMEK